jgi:hypothetical protein
MPVARTEAVSAIAWIARIRAGRADEAGTGPLLRRLSCKYLLTERVTMAVANAITPEVSVRRCGMLGQYGFASPAVKLATRADPIQISTAA